MRPTSSECHPSDPPRPSFFGVSKPYLVLMKVAPHFSEDLIRIMYSFIMVRSRPTTRVPITQGEGLKNIEIEVHKHGLEKCLKYFGPIRDLQQGSTIKSSKYLKRDSFG